MNFLGRTGTAQAFARPFRTVNESLSICMKKTQMIPTIDHKPHAAFFRQSGWLMIATIAGGG
jgi:hypothetical protein